MNFYLTFTIFSISFGVIYSFNGSATFYGEGGASEKGACMLRKGFNGVATTVAMNRDQFAGGSSCGKCIQITGNGEGVGMTPIFGPILATIDNECPECLFGDVDLGLGGDGRWKVHWDFIDCPRKKNLRIMH